MKKTISLLLSVIIALSCVSLGSLSAYAKDYTSGDYKYELQKDGSVKLTEYLGSETVINIPSELDGKKVTAVSNSAFINSEITEVNIPKTVSEIADFAFLRYRNLKASDVNLKAINVDENNKTYSSVDGVLFNKNRTVLYCYPRLKEDKEYEIPKGVKTLYELSFYGTENLEKVTFSSSVREVGKRAFNSSALKEVELNDGLKTIRGNAFGLTNLAEIFIPKSVKKVGTRVFGDCNQYIKIYGYRNSVAQKQLTPKKYKYKFYVVDPVAPKKTTVKGVKGKITVNYKKVKKAKGFEVQAVSGKTKVVKTFETAKSARKTVKSLKKGTYKVKVRAFNIYDGKKIYSPWTAPANVKVK